LKHGGETPVLRWIIHRRSSHNTEFIVEVHRCQDRFTVAHPGVINNILGVVLLQKEEAGARAPDCDTEEGLEHAHVLDPELRGELGDGGLKESG
jgi:hypothetical protein